MAGFADILGQARAVEVLRAALAAGKVHHAYLFEGPAGVGKATVARTLAMSLNCEAGKPLGTASGQPTRLAPLGSPSSETRLACGTCDPCRKILDGTHPDVITFDLTQKGLTERVRELVGLCGFRPHEGRARVVLIDPADELVGAQEQAQAANALLKTLEEPPPGTHFILCTAQARRLPVTVLSRCQRIRFLPIGEEAIARWLVEKHGAEPATAQETARTSGGSPGRALSELAASDDAGARQALLVRLLDVLKKPSSIVLFEAAAEVGADREEADRVLGLLWSSLYDALMLREGLAEGRVSTARAQFADAVFGRWPAATLFGALALTKEAQTLVRGNVSPPLVLEHLLLALAPEIAAPKRARA
jgi:DNA polymerase-3 subunit delta'